MERQKEDHLLSSSRKRQEMVEGRQKRFWCVCVCVHKHMIPKKNPNPQRPMNSEVSQSSIDIRYRPSCDSTPQQAEDLRRWD